MTMDKINGTGSDPSDQKICFLILFRTEAGERMARVVIESLRTFGGTLRDSPVWAFLLEPERVLHALPGLEGIHRFPLVLEESCPPYPFVEKVYACARAEEMAGADFNSLVWLSLDCLIVNPPLLFDLDPAPGYLPADAAFRPVHHRNVGSLADGPLDNYWQGIYQALDVGDMPHTVESFTDQQRIRPYFNTHCFAFNPAVGLSQSWWEYFKAMVTDEAFQAGPCRDEPHRIFLHQAILSALVATRLSWERVRLLPPEYNYPLNLLNEMPPDQRAPVLNSLVNAVYEDAFPWNEIAIQEPLRSWLVERIPGGVEKPGRT
jgi:hypothetical protein